MNTLTQALQQAVHHHQAGQWQEAEQLYRQILQADPRQVEALHLLGVLAYQLGHPDSAIEYIGRALAVDASRAVLHSNLGAAYFAAGRRAEAQACHEQAVRLDPHYARGHYNLGHVLQTQGRLAQAQGCYEQTLRLEPENLAALNNLGIVLQGQGRPAEAHACYEQALRLQPDYAEAHYNRGVAFAAQARWDEAEACYREALRLKPDYVEAHCSLGNVCKEKHRPAEAQASYEEALRLRPDYVEAHHNLGTVYHDEDRLDEAVACYRRALACKPDYAEAHSNLGTVLQDQGRVDEALACFNEALRLQPDHAFAHFNRALLRLLLGNFADGWPEYEWRWQEAAAGVRSFREPRWDGASLQGKTILVWTEQGLGDTLQFIRYMALVKRHGGRVLLECQQPFLRLLQTCPGIDQLVLRGAPLPVFDVEAPLLSLPGILGTSWANLPAEVPYLFPAAAFAQDWHAELAARPEFKIGLVWQGSRTLQHDRRSLSLAAFAPLAALPGARLVSLQKAPGNEQLAGAPFPITAVGERLEDFVDTALAIRALDLVVTVDTATAHLAGALGAPVWVAVPFAPDWRWLLDREDSPWYPTMRLFRQPAPGNWQTVIARMAEALRHLLANRSAGRAKE